MHNPKQRASLSPYAIFFLLGILITAACVGAAWGYKLDLFMAALVGINLATFLLYGYDKAVAGGDGLRVPEAVLHTMALFGGTPGAFFGQRIFRHKTIKGSFQILFWLIVFVQVGLYLLAYWLLERLG